MAAPTPYHWDFDRQTPGETDLPYLTFSVGVFQWLPKASNKGVKKSKAIRVKGYMADREAVFAKAEELCEKLNRERVRIEDPPPWLQKQYSVAKPEGLDVEYHGDDLTGAQVRSLRLRVARQKLLSNGFVKGGDATYVRRQSDQIHLIDFQAASYGHCWTVNLGFHYAFVTPFFQRKRIKTEQYTVLDCALQQRVGAFIDDGRDKWFDYGSDRDRLQAVFEDVSDLCLSLFESFSHKWRNPRWWLGTGGDGKITRRRIRPWDTNDDDGHQQLQFFVAAIAMHLGKCDLARRLLTTLVETADRESDKRFYLKQLQSVRRASR